MTIVSLDYPLILRYEIPAFDTTFQIVYETFVMKEMTITFKVTTRFTSKTRTMIMLNRKFFKSKVILECICCGEYLDIHIILVLA